MNLKTICRQKGIKKSDLTKEDCFRLGQASVLVWLGELLQLSVFNPSKKEIERLFRKKEL
jgi:hypothetical protein